MTADTVAGRLGEYMKKMNVVAFALIVVIVIIMAIIAVETFTKYDLLGLDMNNIDWNNIDWNIGFKEIDWSSYFGNIEFTTVMILEICLVASMALFGIGYYFRN